MKLKPEFKYCCKFKDDTFVQLIRITYMDNYFIEYEILNYNFSGFKGIEDLRRYIEFVRYTL